MLENITPYNDCLVTKVRNFDDLRYALDQAGEALKNMAERVQAYSDTIQTTVDFDTRYDHCDKETFVRLGWSMLGRKSPGDIAYEAMLRSKHGADIESAKMICPATGLACCECVAGSPCAMAVRGGGS